MAMGMHQGPAVPDTFGLPTYYVQDILQEDAGNGNVRIWVCAHRGNVAVPQCELIVSAETALLLARRSADFAEAIVNESKTVRRNAH